MNVPGQTCSESEANIFFCSHDSCEYRTPCNLMDLECTDDSSFIDAKGWGCAAWCGYDCSEYDTYTAAELTAVQTNCPLSCNLCSGGKNAKGMAPTCPNGGTACCCDIDSSCTDGDDDWCCPEASSDTYDCSKIEVLLHPDAQFNGIYVRASDKWNGHAHWAKGDKNLFFYNRGEGGAQGWNLGIGDSNEGFRDIFEGGWVSPQPGSGAHGYHTSPIAKHGGKITELNQCIDGAGRCFVTMECTTKPADTATPAAAVNTGISVQYKSVLVFAGVVSVLAISSV